MAGRKLWMIALAVWLLLTGLLMVTNFRFEAQGLILGLLAIVSAALLAFDR